MMDKRQGALAAILGLVIVAGLAFWWTTREPDVVSVAPAPAPMVAAPMAATVSAPLANAPTAATAPGAEFDAVALEEEVVDQIRKEGEDLASRAKDLESQVQDGEALIALKEKQIRELEDQLKKLQASPAP